MMSFAMRLGHHYSFMLAVVFIFFQFAIVADGIAISDAKNKLNDLVNG